MIYSESTSPRAWVRSAWCALILTFLIMFGPFMSLVPFQRPRPPSVLSHSLPAQQPLPTSGINTHGAEERDRTQATKYRISKCVHTSEIKALFQVTKKKCLKAVLATSSVSSSSCQHVLLLVAINMPHSTGDQ